MLIDLPNYTIYETIHERGQTIIYRGKRKIDNVNVIIKTLKKQSSNQKRVSRLAHEYEILQKIQSPHVIKAYALDQMFDQPILILEDSGSQPLINYLKTNQHDFFQLLSIGIKIAEGIGDLHHAYIIHKDINSRNILINPQTLDIKIIDFGISTMISREIQQIINPDLLEGTLAYISPEQTGRMNRAIDYRTDIYSFGVVLYEMFTGELPFRSEDLMELVYCHIAKMPRSPSEVKTTIPETIAAVTMKCLNKSAEDRYHSAYGLKNDLEECLQLLSIKTPGVFIPGLRDVYDQFQIPETLYGRENEKEQLLKAFERASHGGAELLLVSGYAGVGKTSLINEAQRPIVQKRGYYIAGKFDQFKKNIPYSALIQAFQDLVRQLLSESEQSLSCWRNQILRALKSDGQVIIDIIPEIQYIIGKQPPAQELDSQAAENRFYILFTSFIKAFLSDEHPIVIFLDDLQWADSASLKVLQLFVTDDSIRHLFIAGAYRDNEVDATHLLSEAIREIQKENGRIEFMEIKLLELKSVEQLVCDTFHSFSQNITTLAHIIYQKTQGNPFFIIQFLKFLYEKGFINFEKKKKSWEAEIEKISQLQVTDNVAEFMSQKIRTLSCKTQNLLKIASAIGNTFDLQTLAAVYGSSPAQTSLDLKESLMEELILIQQANEAQYQTIYRFQHDRIQQAAHQLIPVEERELLQYTIGRILLSTTPFEKRDEKIIEIVNQLNNGLNTVREEQEKIEIAELNLQASGKAIRATAYSPALSFLKTAISCLPTNHWESYYSLSLSLHETLATTHFLSGNVKDAENILDLLIKKVKTNLEKGKVYLLYSMLYINLGNFSKSLEICKKALSCFGEHFPSTNLKWWVLWENFKLKFQLFFTKLEDLAYLHESKDPKDMLIEQISGSIHIATGLLQLAYLQEWNILKAFNRTMRRGLTAFSTTTISRYGVILISESVQKYEYAERIGEVAAKIAKRFNVIESINIKTRIDLWTKSFKVIVPSLKNSVDQVFAAGLIEQGSQYLFIKTLLMLLKGDPLEIVYSEILINKKIVTKTKSAYSYYELAALEEICKCLQGKTSDPTDTSVKEPLILNYTPHSFDAYREPWDIFLFFLNERYEAVLKKAEEIENYYNNYSGVITRYPGIITSTIYYFYHALTLTALYPKEKNKWKARKKLSHYHKEIKRWAEANPVNHQHQYYLFSAELARCYNETVRAMQFYDKAIEAAKVNEFLHEEAIACELAAKFHLNENRKVVASSYMSAAYKAYSRWGAGFKLKLLKEKYAELLATEMIPEKVPASETETLSIKGSLYTFEGPLYTLESKKEDFDIVTYDAQTISEETALEKIIEKSMSLLMNYAEVNRIFLILIDQEKLVIQARAEEGKLEMLPGIPLDQKMDQLCIPIIQYVRRTEKELVLNNVSKEGFFINDPYIIKNQIQSVLCLPIIHLEKMLGIFYFENKLARDAFSTTKLKTLSLLTTQMAISIEHSMFYSELNSKAQDLSEKLEGVQKRLNQHEKMVSIELTTAGIAAELAEELRIVMPENKSDFQAALFQDFKTSLDQLLKFTKKIYTQANKSDTIEITRLEYVNGASGDLAPINIHKLIEDSIIFSLKEAQTNYPDLSIEILKDFDYSVETLEISGHDITRVLHNLFINSCWAVSQKKLKLGAGFKPIFSIKTQNLGKSFEIRIRDNGIGISPKEMNKIFTPFYTTKEGAGLGLSLSRSLVIKNEGTLRFDSREGEFTEFIILLPIL